MQNKYTVVRNGDSLYQPETRAQLEPERATLRQAGEILYDARLQ